MLTGSLSPCHLERKGRALGGDGECLWEGREAALMLSVLEHTGLGLTMTTRDTQRLFLETAIAKLSLWCFSRSPPALEGGITQYSFPFDYI